jgi:hypothetical protein
LLTRKVENSVMANANLIVSLVADPGNATASKELLEQIDSIEKKAVDMGKEIRRQLSSAWTSAHDASVSAVTTMKQGLDTLQKIGQAQETIQAKAKEHSADQLKFFSGMGELASSSLDVVKNIAQLGTSSEESSKAVEAAFTKIEKVFKAFEGSINVLKTANGQLKAFKELRNVESPAMNVGDAAKALWSKGKQIGGKAASLGGDLLGDVSPKLLEAAEKTGKTLKSAFTAAGSKLKAAFGAAEPTLKAAASTVGEVFGKLGKFASGALGKVSSVFGSLTGVAGGIVAVIGAAVASIVVSLDKMFNNGRMIGSLKRRWDHFFGYDLPTGEIDDKKLNEDTQKHLDELHFANATKAELREGQREFFASQGRAGDFDKYDLEQANKDVQRADAEFTKFREQGSKDQSLIPKYKEENLAAYDRVKQAQEGILQTTRETTRELQSQLTSQRQQVAEAAKLVEQEKVRFQGRKADFARLPKDVRDQLAAIGNKIGSGKDLTDAEAELSDKYGFFHAATTKHYAGQVTEEQAGALQRGGESGVEAAVNALKEARQGEQNIQKAVEDSVRHEREQTDAIYKTRQKIAELKWEYWFGNTVPKLNTELPNLGDGSAKQEGQPAASPKQASDAADPQQKASKNEAASQTVAEFKTALDRLLKNELVPAILSLVSRTAARINNAR